MDLRVIVINFDQESLSYQAFSEIKKLHIEGKLKVEQMGVIFHQEGGSHKFDMKDFIDFTGNDHSAKNSTIGMLIGLLGGPLGMLLGWFAGSMIGNVQDAKEITDATSVFEYVGSHIAEGETGLVLIANEEDNRPLNEIIFSQLGGHISRLDLKEVEQELADAQALEKEVQAKAKNTWEQRKKLENKE